ncbi:MAG: hypothetical protein J6J61_06825 [Muribaculaceae bacterium]|nr:hypothetical protein [Muribaculaceae bacterium]
MIKRKITIGTYDTAAHGWTLTSWSLSEAQQKTNYINIPGGDGTRDASTALTDGIPTYNDRIFTATLECSEGDRLHRESLIREMVNELDGMRWDIELPDDDLHHIEGRVHVARLYNDPAHGSVRVTATCKPWKFNNTDTVATLTASTTAKTAELKNNGRRAVVPTLKVTGTGANVLLKYGTASMAMGPGTYQWADLLLTPGSHRITYSGTGTLVVSYREAVLE